VNPQVRFFLSSHDLVTIGGELSEGTLESPDFDTKVVRVQKALYLSHESRFDFSRNLFNRLIVYETIRYDRISDVDVALTPKFGANLALTRVGDIRLRGSIGQSFRSPSFNDLYYRGFSNPNLKAERSTSFDAGFTSTFVWGGVHSIEYTYFHQDIDDRIIFDLTTFLPMNIGKVLSTGSEVKYNGSFFRGKATFGLNYAFTDARKKNADVPNDPTFDHQLANAPTDVVNISAGVVLNPLVLNVSHAIVGSRYLTLDHTASMPSYRVTNLGVVIRQPFASWKIIAKGEVNNIFDNDYEVIRGYPMPKRNYRLTLGLEY
jgi:outer membrane cobalamin receptor